MKILFLSRWFPYPPDNGSKIRIYNLIRQLAAHHSMDLISFTSEKVEAAQLEALQPYCGRVETALYRPFEPGSWQALAGFVSQQPRSLVDTHSDELEGLAKEAARRVDYDIVIASQIDMVPYALDLPVRVKIFEEIELTTPYEQANGQTHRFKTLRSRLTWNKLMRFLEKALPRFDGITVVSEQERQRLCEIVPGHERIQVIPNGVDLDYLAGNFGQPQPDTLIYNGALTFGANFDAMTYFLKDIFPLIRKERPRASLYITGKTEGVRLQDLPACEGVVFTGYLSDIRPRVAQSWVSVVPLRQGGGTRLKVLESMALHTPVVSTCKGAEGLDVHAGEDILLADSPAEFAGAVLRLLGDARLRENLSQAGYQNVSQRYSWDTIGTGFIGFLEQVAGGSEYGRN